MKLQNQISELENHINDPSSGLPDEIFFFATRITPMVNVDLLIQNDRNETLLTWRGGSYYSPGWHIPGGIVRLRESMYDRIDQVAKDELGALVTYNSNPIVINEIIRLPERINRTHFISFLFKAKLSSTPKQSLQYKNSTPEDGQWSWHQSCPSNIIPVHLMYRNIINGASPEPECVSDFGMSRIISLNKLEGS